MPSPIVAIDLIKTSMRLIGAIATGETPSADEAADGLRALNDVLERWSIESLAVYGNLPEVYATVAGQSLYSYGPGGNWDAPRPAFISNLYTTVDGMDYPAQEWALEEYNAVALKSQRQPIVERWVFVNDAPLAQVILWPTPSRSTPITLDTPRILTQVAAISTTMTLPPGYASALQYAVAEELAPQYGSPIDVSARARAAKALIKRANRTSRTMSFDPTLVPNGGAGASIYGW